MYWDDDDNSRYTTHDDYETRERDAHSRFNSFLYETGSYDEACIMAHLWEQD